ncbi:MAG: MBL fold metallo-hydrolase [Bacteroidaceae bacterium]|nr:MBL fold metallo-hydrolase [Bacteroidaceae bacterium]
MLKIKAFALNMLQTNCYVLSDASREAVVVDCGAFFDEEFAEIESYIREESLCLKHHLLTHGHFDHCFGAWWIFEHYGLLPEVSQKDAETYRLQPVQIQLFMHRAIPLQQPALGPVFNEGDHFSFGTHTLQVIATPGHTPGGVCFYEPDEGLLLSGDSLFRGSIGRCDLPGSDAEALPRALREKILTLPPETRVLPGHGPATSVAYEHDYNPYLN